MKIHPQLQTLLMAPLIMMMPLQAWAYAPLNLQIKNATRDTCTLTKVDTNYDKFNRSKLKIIEVGEVVNSTFKKKKERNKSKEEELSVLLTYQCGQQSIKLRAANTNITYEYAPFAKVITHDEGIQAIYFTYAPLYDANIVTFRIFNEN